MLRIIKVTGDSLSPVYNDGDFVLIAKIPFLLVKPKVGDVVIFRHPIYGQMIKKVASIMADEDKIFVIGLHEHSVDSRQFGAVSRKEIIGKVLWHIKKPVS